MSITSIDWWLVGGENENDYDAQPHTDEKHKTSIYKQLLPAFTVFLSLISEDNVCHCVMLPQDTKKTRWNSLPCLESILPNRVETPYMMHIYGFNF